MFTVVLCVKWLYANTSERSIKKANRLFTFSVNGG